MDDTGSVSCSVTTVVSAMLNLRILLQRRQLIYLTDERLCKLPKCARINIQSSVAAGLYKMHVPGCLDVGHLKEVAALGFLGTMEGGDSTS